MQRIVLFIAQTSNNYYKRTRILSEIILKNQSLLKNIIKTNYQHQIRLPELAILFLKIIIWMKKGVFELQIINLEAIDNDHLFYFDVKNVGYFFIYRN